MTVNVKNNTRPCSSMLTLTLSCCMHSMYHNVCEGAYTTARTNCTLYSDRGLTQLTLVGTGFPRLSRSPILRTCTSHVYLIQAALTMVAGRTSTSPHSSQAISTLVARPGRFSQLFSTGFPTLLLPAPLPHLLLPTPLPTALPELVQYHQQLLHGYF